MDGWVMAGRPTGGWQALLGSSLWMYGLEMLAHMLLVSDSAGNIDP